MKFINILINIQENEINFEKILKNNFLKLNLIIIFINIILLLLNSFLIIKNKKIYNSKKLIEFKKIDFFNINLISLTYEQISNYLNIKYNYQIKFNNLKLIKNKKLKRKIIKLECIDLFNRSNLIKWLKSKLRNKFKIKFEFNNPDYLIFNVFGNKHLNKKYKNAIKIAIFTENYIPNLKEVDYAIGHYHINYLDRYFKYSVFLWEDFNNIIQIRQKVLNSPIRNKFCAAVISNAHTSDGFRIRFINELNKYKKIDMGGKYKNNIGKRIKNKIKFLLSYKFSISMENSNGDGYITEKIVQSFISGTIPIYYGDYMIDEYINPKSYILIRGINDIKTKINYIKEIDNDDAKYKNILKENVIIDNNFINKIDKELKLFLINIFEQDKIKAYRSNK